MYYRLFSKKTREVICTSYLNAKLVVISFMTLAETDRWALERNWGRTKRRQMAEFLKQFVVSPFNRDLCLNWARAMHSARRNGRPIQTADGWVAATALLHGIPLVTHNLKHFLGVDGLQVVSESTA